VNDTVNTPLQSPAQEPLPPAGAPLPARAWLRELMLAALCLVLGIVVMPCLIFAMGRGSLGPYEHGGVFALWRDFLVGLSRGSEAFWFVALSPYLLLCVLRLLRRLLHK
jgi:hypothetical protein